MLQVPGLVLIPGVGCMLAVWLLMLLTSWRFEVRWLSRVCCGGCSSVVVLGKDRAFGGNGQRGEGGFEGG